MSYLNKILLPNEKVIYKGNRDTLSIFAFLLPIGLIIPIFLAFMGVLMTSITNKVDYTFIGSVILVFSFLSIICYFISKIISNKTELAITNKRVIAKFGIIRTDTIEIYLNKIESIRVEQGILGKLLGYGTIIIHGYGGSETPIIDIKDPLNFKKELELLYDKLKPNTDFE